MNNNISDNQNITIRKGNETDLPEMLSLFKTSIDEVCKKDYDQHQLEAWKSGADNKERWIKVIRDQYVLVAVSGNQIAGFCTLDQGNYIDLLFVHKDYQQKGIASILYNKVEKEVRLHHQMQITADVSKTARPFFERIGFHVIQEQKVNIKGIALTNYKMAKNLS